MSAEVCFWVVRGVCWLVLGAGAVLVPFGLLGLIRAGMPPAQGFDAAGAEAQMPRGCGVAGLVGVVVYGALLGGVVWGCLFFTK